MVETIINHPPVITISMGAINHSQSWLVDSIVLPTLHRLEFDVIGSCPAVPSLPPPIPVPSGPKRNLHLFKLMQVSTLLPHPTPSEKVGPLKYVYINIYEWLSKCNGPKAAIKVILMGARFLSNSFQTGYL